MDKRSMNFSLLGVRQKRRRLITMRTATHEHNVRDSDDASSSDQRSDNETLRVDSPLALREDFQNPDDELSSDDYAETESSCEEDTEEEMEERVEDEEEAQEEEEEVYDGHNPAENLREGRDMSESDTSEDENEIIHVQHDPAYLQKQTLKNVFLAANIKHKQGNMLLKTLRQFPFNLISLPTDSRTLLQTPTVVASAFVEQIAGGEYLHIGFESTLRKKLKTLPANMLPERIIIDLSTDGAMMDKGKDQFWPHQYRIFNIKDQRPIIAGIFQGRHKPSNPFDFYEKLVREITEIRNQGGIRLRNRQLPVRVRCFIADAPARAFVLNHYGHMSSNACSKCHVEGHRCTVPGFIGTMIFEGIRHRLRTDEEYRNLIDEDHHKGRCPLFELLGLVSHVPFESMHLVWLGNVKKVISAKVDGKYGHQRLNGRKLNILNSRMRLLKSYCPSEFNRRPNEFNMYHSFKATEFRQLLLYTSPAVFKNVFDPDYYSHFMILHAVMRLLSSAETPREMYAFCQEALETYVTMCEQLYGQQFLSYNVHGLLHLVADVENLGSLETFSAFCFENNMPALRKLIRKPGLKLAQIYKRMCEMNDVVLELQENNIPNIRLSKSHTTGPLVEDIPPHICQQFSKVEVDKFTFSTALRNSCCIIQDARVCIIKNIVKIEEDIILIVGEFRTVTEIYNVGVASDDVGVYHCTDLSDRVQAVNLKDVKSKCYRMPQWSDVEGEEELVIENKWICVALLTPTMKNTEDEKLSKLEKLKSADKYSRVSSKGRIIKPPKKIMTTSSDDAPVRKKSASTKIMATELERLKKLADDIKRRNQRTYDDTNQDDTLNIMESQETCSANISAINAQVDTCIQSPSSAVVSQDHLKKTSNVYDCSATKTAEAGITLTDVRVRGTSQSTSSIYKDTNRNNNEQAIESALDNRLKKIEDTLERIETQNIRIAEQNEEILQNLRSQKNVAEVGLHDQSLYERLKGFPLRTVEEFKESDDADLGKEKRRQLYHHLLRLGGTKLREFLACGIKQSMTDNLVCQFTWNGSKETEKFGNTKFAYVFYQAARDCPLFHGPENKAQFKIEMQEVIRATKQRYRNFVKTKNRPQTEESTSESEDEGTVLEKIGVLERNISARQSAHDHETSDSSTSSP